MPSKPALILDHAPLLASPSLPHAPQACLPLPAPRTSCLGLSWSSTTPLARDATEKTIVERSRWHGGGGGGGGVSGGDGGNLMDNEVRFPQ